MASADMGIVVIEDDHHISDLVALYLRRDGFRVVQADDAERGLAAHRPRTARLVVLDLGLPASSTGSDVCRRLRRGEPPGPRPDPECPRRRGRPHPGPRARGRRLRHQAVQRPRAVARVHAILRRTGASGTTEGPAIVGFGAVSVDTGRREARRDDEVVPLATRRVRPPGLPRSTTRAWPCPANSSSTASGVRLVRRRADRRRARPPAPQEARPRPAARHRVGRRLPPRMSAHPLGPRPHPVRQRLTIAIIALVLVTVAATSIGSYVLIRRATISTAEQELSRRGAGHLHDLLRPDRPRPRSRSAGSWPWSPVPATSRRCSSCCWPPTAPIAQPLDAGLTTGDIDPQALLAGEQVTGHTPGLLDLLGRAHPAAGHHRRDTGADRVPSGPQPGRRDPLLRPRSASSGVAAAALVAAALARRFTRPVVAAVDTTRRIASGDLDAASRSGPTRIPSSPSWPTRSTRWGRTWPGPATRSGSS